MCLLAAVVLYLTPLSRSLSGKTSGLLLGGLALVSLVHIGIGLPGVLRRSETSAGWIALLLVHGLIVLVYLLLLLLRLNFAP
ncbi:hypothetical protein N6H14_08755 [Paenibacillus sp. CC-CFT747]|nr:hypothetical protein N6H14_08755 [Paenibacillus sp. CC-CFT747]